MYCSLVTISSIQNWSAGETLGFEIEYLNIDIQHAYKNIGFRYSDVQNYLIQKPNYYNFQKKIYCP